LARKATGQVVERKGKRGRVYALRFRAYGRREYATLGTAEEGWTRRRAEEQLANVLADVRRGIWRPAEPTEPERPTEAPTFHVFASEWLADRRREGVLRPRTLEDYEWALTHHLLPYFADFQLSAITKRHVDAYKTHKATEGVIAPNQINKTLTRLSQILALAEEYELISGNPAFGRKRRLARTKPRRAWVEPEQVPALLEASDQLLAGRGRPLLATLIGAGLRISEALALERRHVNLTRGTVVVEQAKTEAGERTIDLPPALRDELALWLDRSPFKAPTALVFPTTTGKPDNRNNVRRRLLVKAVERANKRLAELGIEPIGRVAPHGLRRTYASLRHAAGDDVAYTSAQLGHEDPTFTLKIYVHAAKRRERLTEAERREFNRTVEWAQWAQTGTGAAVGPSVVVSAENDLRRDADVQADLREWSVPGSNR
jgi:integrase